MTSNEIKEHPHFILLGEMLSFKGAIDLGNGFILKKPNSRELRLIKLAITKAIEFTVDHGVNRYERKLVQIEENHWQYEHILNQRDYKYSIIEFPLVGEITDMLSFSNKFLNLCDIDLSPLYCFRSGGYGQKRLTSKVFNFFNLYGSDYCEIKIDQTAINNIRETIELTKNYEKSEKFEFIEKSFLDFSNHKEIGRNLNFKIVVLVGILEQLLTDGSKNRINSLSRQLQKKIKLLNSFSNKPIDYKDFFKGPDTLTIEKVIETIYVFRSKIAHGETVEFEKKLELLKNVELETIVEFLLSITKNIIKVSISNQTMVSNLKEC